MIKIDVNNGRQMEVFRGGMVDTTGKVEECIQLAIRENEELKLDRIIPDGDFVMLMNYYRYVKDNNIQCDFINPNGQQVIK